VSEGFAQGLGFLDLMICFLGLSLGGVMLQGLRKYVE
jgi:hypothetical protein